MCRQPSSKDTALDAFDAGVGFTSLCRRRETAYPWEEPYAREDVMKQVLLRMPKAPLSEAQAHHKLHAHNMTSFILERITPETEKEIARMTSRGEGADRDTLPALEQETATVSILLLTRDIKA